MGIVGNGQNRENSKMKAATSKDWKIKPLPKKRSLIPVDRQFTSGEMNRIKRGFIPTVMEEKWFVFFKSNRLYFHRSWTGYGVFVAHFKLRQQGFVLHLIEANRDSRQYTEQDDAYDAKLVSDIIDNFLLAPQTSKGPAGLVAALEQSSKPNYLGDPKVVGNLLRKYRDMAVESRKSKIGPGRENGLRSWLRAGDGGNISRQDACLRADDSVEFARPD